MLTSRSAAVRRGLVVKARCRACANEIAREAPSAAAAGTEQRNTAQKIRATKKKLGIRRTLKRNGRAGLAARTKNSDAAFWGWRIEGAKLMQISSPQKHSFQLEDACWRPCWEGQRKAPDTLVMLRRLHYI